MPYSGSSDKSLPKNIKKLSAKERTRWAEVYNSSYSRGKEKGGSDCERVALRDADGVLKNASTTFAGLFGGKKALGRAFVEFSAAEPPDTIHLFPAPGSFKHPVWGKFDVTEEGNREFVANFNAHVYQEKVPIDAEHEGKLSGAVGYIEELTLNDDLSIEAAVEWTERGEKLIKGDSYQYISPEWFTEWSDPATEEEFENVIIGAALTNRPFFKELRSLVASEGHLYDVEDGAGRVPVVRSAIEGVSYNDLQDMILSAARHEFPSILGGSDYGWVVDLYDDYVILCGNDGSTYWRLGYTYGKDDEIEFPDQPGEVQRRTVWDEVSRRAKEDDQDTTRRNTNHRKEKHMATKVDDMVKEAEELDESGKQSLLSRLASGLKATVKFGHDPADDDDAEGDDENDAEGTKAHTNDDDEGETDDNDSKTAAEVVGLKTKLEMSEKAREASDQRLGKLETSARTARFREIILGRDEDSVRKATESEGAITLHPMVGELDAKMKILEALEEGSEAFTNYVASERAHAAQLHAAGTFGELGTDSQGGSVEGSAVKQYEAKIKDLCAADSGLSEADAIAKIAKDDPKLYDAYDKEKTDRKASYPTS